MPIGATFQTVWTMKFPACSIFRVKITLYIPVQTKNVFEYSSHIVYSMTNVVLFSCIRKTPSTSRFCTFSLHLKLTGLTNGTTLALFQFQLVLNILNYGIPGVFCQWNMLTLAWSTSQSSCKLALLPQTNYCVQGLFIECDPPIFLSSFNCFLTALSWKIQETCIHSCTNFQLSRPKCNPYIVSNNTSTFDSKN